MTELSRGLSVESQEEIGAGKVYIIVVNWNGWPDTIECLESVFRSLYGNYQVVVSDNGSQDGSIDRIREWAEGELQAKSSPHPSLSRLTYPPVPKPISVVEYDRTTAEKGGDTRLGDARLILIETGENLGFAGGNNVALRLALARDDFEYVWLLNNDTVVSATALSALIRRLQERPDAGLCASTLLYYHEPNTVQVRGGISYGRWFATMRPLGKGQSADRPIDQNNIEQLMDYPAGASVLVRREFLCRVGLLTESYFLYYEELDWVTRAGDRFTLAYSPESLVYHKEGQSIQAADADAFFHTADYYAHRNRLRYTRHYFPLAVPTAALRTLVAVLTRLYRRQPRRAWGILRLMFSRETYAFPQRDPGPGPRRGVRKR